MTFLKTYILISQFHYLSGGLTYKAADRLTWPEACDQAPIDSNHLHWPFSPVTNDANLPMWELDDDLEPQNLNPGLQGHVSTNSPDFSTRPGQRNVPDGDPMSSNNLATGASHANEASRQDHVIEWPQSSNLNRGHASSDNGKRKKVDSDLHYRLRASASPFKKKARKKKINPFMNEDEGFEISKNLLASGFPAWKEVPQERDHSPTKADKVSKLPSELVSPELEKAQKQSGNSVINEDEIFSLPGIPLERFAWLHTLILGKMQANNENESEKELRHNVEKLTESSTDHLITEFGAWLKLMNEVYDRHMAFLLRLNLTPLDKLINPLVKEKMDKVQENLFDWLYEQLSPDKLEAFDSESNAKNSFGRTIIDLVRTQYKQKGPDSMRWELKAAAQSLNLDKLITEREAMLTRDAITILGNYYKHTNITRWKMLFEEDDDFLQLFIRMKLVEQNKNEPKCWSESLPFLEGHFFSWNDVPILPDSNDEKDISSSWKKVLTTTKLHTTMQRFQEVTDTSQ